MDDLRSPLSRRTFLGKTALLAAAAVLPSVLRSSPAATSRSLPLVKRVVAGPAATYFAYTHANAFLPDGCTHVLARVENEGLTYLSFNPVDGGTRQLGSIKGADMYYSLSDDGRTMAVTNGSAILGWDVGSTTPPRDLFRVPAGEENKWGLNVSDISPDGKSVVAMLRHRGTPYKTLPDGRSFQYQLLKHDIAAARTDIAMEAGWWLNHMHFSPFDPRWVSLAHEGDADKVPDRLWAWHEKEAPEGRMLFKQTDTDGQPLYVGHERSCFHKPSCIFIAFGGSPGNPTGLYEVDFQGESRLVSEGLRDWHCNISRDGRWAVVDTTGPHDAPGRGWENAGSTSDILIVNTRTGKRAFVHRSSQTRHPYHPHPHISPDQRWIVFNDAKSRRAMAVEIDQRVLKTFLES
jgi:hypothetical protein